MKFWADENFNGAVLSGLLDEMPDLDVVRVQDTTLSGVDDITLLEEAAKARIILLTHDKQTLVNFAYSRVRAGQLMPGVIEVSQDTPIGLAISDLVLLIGTSFPSDFENQVRYIPFS